MKQPISITYHFGGLPKKWYNEYHTGIRIHDYFSLMINQFPVVVIRKYDQPHSESRWVNYSIGILGFTFSKLIDEPA